MKPYRKLTIALAAVLALCTACSGNGNKNAATPTPAQPGASAPNPAAPVESPAAATGETSSLLPHAGDTVAFTGLGADLGLSESKDSPVYKVYQNTIGNIDIQWELVPMSDFDTKAMLYFNSGDVPDIVWFRAPMLMRDYSTAGLFVDLNRYAEMTPNWNRAKQKFPGLTTYQTAKGEQLMIHEVSNDYAGETFYANMDVLNKHGIALPTSLEEMEAAMQRIHDADPAITPFQALWNIQQYKVTFKTLIGANDGMYFDRNAKAWKHAVLEPDSGYKDLISLMADYRAKGYFHPEFATMSDEQTNNLMASGRWAFTYAYVDAVTAWYNIDVSQTPPGNIEAFLPPMRGAAKPVITSTYVSDDPYWGFSVSARCKNPELAASWIDAMLSKPVATAYQWGIEGTSYTVAADGAKEWKPDFLAQGAQAIKDLGIANVQGPRFITWRDDLSIMRRTSELMQGTYRLLNSALEDGTADTYYDRTTPTLGDAEADEYSRIMTAAKTKIDENEALFILGSRPLSEWDAYIAEIKAVADLQRAVDLYNAGAQKPDRVPQSERNYLIP